MQITIIRKYRKPEYTIGRLYIDGAYVCDTLEDTDRGLTSDMSAADIQRQKVKGQTAIPTGAYSVTITYSPRFRRRLPLISGVKGFDGIRIHPGNTAKDTEGCILPGMNTVKGSVTHSRQWYAVIFGRIREALAAGQRVSLAIHNE